MNYWVELVGEAKMIILRMRLQTFNATLMLVNFKLDNLYLIVIATKTW